MMTTKTNRFAEGVSRLLKPSLRSGVTLSWHEDFLSLTTVFRLTLPGGEARCLSISDQQIHAAKSGADYLLGLLERWLRDEGVLEAHSFVTVKADTSSLESGIQQLQGAVRDVAASVGVGPKPPKPARWDRTEGPTAPAQAAPRQDRAARYITLDDE